MSSSLSILQEYHEGILNRNEIIFKYTLWCVALLTDIKHTRLMHSLDYKSVDARALCCYIVYTHSSMSFADIARRFSRSKSGIHKAIAKMKWCVETPGLYEEFTQIAEMTTHLLDTYLTETKHG